MRWSETWHKYEYSSFTIVQVLFLTSMSIGDFAWLQSLLLFLLLLTKNGYFMIWFHVSIFSCILLNTCDWSWSSPSIFIRQQLTQKLRSLYNPVELDIHIPKYKKGSSNFQRWIPCYMMEPPLFFSTTVYSFMKITLHTWIPLCFGIWYSIFIHQVFWVHFLCWPPKNKVLRGRPEQHKLFQFWINYRQGDFTQTVPWLRIYDFQYYYLCFLKWIEKFS